MSTGKERDAETGLDYFGARYMSSAQGRFTSPDAPFVDQHPANPQSWNLYSYVRNSPLVNVDPTGRACVANPGEQERTDDSIPGPSCEEIAEQDKTAKPSATAYGGPNAPEQEVTEALQSFIGEGPKQLVYGQNSPFTQYFKDSAGMQAIIAGIRRDCSATTGGVPVGTFEAFVNGVIDGVVGGRGFYNPHFQLGAFNTTFSKQSNGRVDITVTNPISLNSAAYHLTSKVGIPNPTEGPLGTVNQTLQFAIADPCRAN